MRRGGHEGDREPPWGPAIPGANVRMTGSRTSYDAAVSDDAVPAEATERRTLGGGRVGAQATVGSPPGASGSSTRSPPPTSGSRTPGRRSGPIDTAFRAFERDTAAGGGVLSAAVAFRAFLFLVPYVFFCVVTFGLASRRRRRARSDLARSVGVSRD